MYGSRISSTLRRVGQFAGGVDALDGAVGQQDFVGDGRGGLDDFDVELALQPFLDDLHVQQAEEAAAEAEAQGVAGFGLEGEAGIVELQPVHRVAQVFVLRLAAGVEIAEDHLLDRLVAGQRLGGGLLGVGDGVADADVVQVLDGGDDETHLAGADPLDLLGAGHQLAQVGDLVLALGAHQADLLALFQLAVDDADIDDDAAVVVVDAVEDQRPGRGVGRCPWAAGSWSQSLVISSSIPCPVLADTRIASSAGKPSTCSISSATRDRVGAGQVDLVDDRNDLQPHLDGGVGVGDGLRLHALRGVDHQDRPFARLQGLLDFVVEVHVAGRVDEVQHELFAVVLVEDGDGGGLDGDAALALQVHVVEHLVLELALGDGAGPHEQAVGERALAVVDVGDDGEVPNLHRVTGGGPHGLRVRLPWGPHRRGARGAPGWVKRLSSARSSPKTAKTPRDRCQDVSRGSRDSTKSHTEEQIGRIGREGRSIYGTGAGSCW